MKIQKNYYLKKKGKVEGTTGNIIFSNFSFKLNKKNNIQSQGKSSF